MVLSMPAVEKGRYYSAEINDLYTFIAGYIGTRTTGNAAPPVKPFKNVTGGGYRRAIYDVTRDGWPKGRRRRLP